MGDFLQNTLWTNKVTGITSPTPQGYGKDMAKDMAKDMTKTEVSASMYWMSLKKFVC